MPMKLTNLTDIFSVSDEKEAKLIEGLTSIERGNIHRFRPDSKGCFGTHIVIDNETNLWGLISNDNEEVLPCIFDEVNVTLSGFIEVQFKRRYYSFMILSKDFKPDHGSDSFVFYGGIWYYQLGDNKIIKNYENTGIDYSFVELDEITQKLISLLTVSHAPQYMQ